jgi:7-carboxy-7-deazaguanine synthase
MNRIKDYTKRLPILELYPCIQSEGSRQGRPTIAVRTTGCTHRCWFGEGGWCDSWYTSIHPEKGKYSFLDIMQMYDANPDITEMMLTGGSPTMHPDLVNELTHFAQERGIFITMETEGSHFLQTDYPIDLISLSPKFSNSIPKLGILTPKGNLVDEKFIQTHNRDRLNLNAIRETLSYHKDFHFKPVWDGALTTIQEIEDFRITMGIPKSKTWLMPAGDTRQTLIEEYPKSIEKAQEMGYCWTGRDHIIAFDTKRAV